jgi:hypothetical protein
MSSEIETSSDGTNRYLHTVFAFPCAPLTLTTRLHAGIFLALTCLAAAVAQETPTPAPAVSPIAQESPATSVAPAQTPSPSPARSVRISFVPPPMEGTISLGIYDGNGKLVRVLHRQAQLNELTIGPDALVTQWDGKDDGGADLPAGKYRARGYLVGAVKVEDLGQVSAPVTENASSSGVKVKLVPNPLRKEKRSVIELAVGYSGDGSYLKTGDGLPLFILSKTPNLLQAGITRKSENAVEVWQNDGTSIHRFRISNVDQMMAFDCGEFELR